MRDLKIVMYDLPLKSSGEITPKNSQELTLLKNIDAVDRKRRLFMNNITHSRNKKRFLPTRSSTVQNTCTGTVVLDILFGC
mmetsp:Transcript_11297/g.17139  ORF Transcript_11297/g.17139 Transcript_11297/m.17139 type:complete len:81 (-) Transcript_11297:2213-2455(-)